MEKQCRRTCPAEIRDYGGAPLVVNIDEVSNANQNFRTALWTGMHLQVTLMSIPAGGDIGAEVHPDVGQFLRGERGGGLAVTGWGGWRRKQRRRVEGHSAVIIPAGTWHNIVNTGNRPLKLYSVYAPPQHPFGTVHRTKTDAV